jgi:transcriptional regulator with XRE-family HTH domain
MSHRPRKIFFDNVDWSQSDAEIARALGCTKSYVSKHRRGMRSAQESRNAVRRQQYWRQRMENLANGLNCSGTGPRREPFTKTERQQRNRDYKRQLRADFLARGLRADGKPRKNKLYWKFATARERAWRELRAGMGIKTNSWDDVILAGSVENMKREAA